MALSVWLWKAPEYDDDDDDGDNDDDDDNNGGDEWTALCRKNNWKPGNLRDKRYDQGQMMMKVASIFTLTVGTQKWSHLKMDLTPQSFYHC